jgi:hypothetical protein
MPWEHCDVSFILDDEACPTCGQTKGAWTVQVEKTRTLVIGSPRGKKAFIDIELRDAAGRPRAGRPYRVALPSGLVREGALDERGRVRLERLSPGACVVTFPQDEASARHAVAAELAATVRDGPFDVAALDPAQVRTGEASDPITLTKEQLARGGGELYVFEPARWHWIEVRLSDDAGAPRGGERFRVEFQDGTPAHEGALDDAGFARVDRLPLAGPCDVVFPDLLLDQVTLEADRG